MASAGHPATQAPQSMQVPSSTDAAPSFMVIAPTGQVPVQASHPTHFDESTFAAIINSSFFQSRGWLPRASKVNYTLNGITSSKKSGFFRFSADTSAKKMKKKGNPLLHFCENGVYLSASSAPVAQLDRASGYGPEGCRFKSYQVHHFVRAAHLPKKSTLYDFLSAPSSVSSLWRSFPFISAVFQV